MNDLRTQLIDGKALADRWLDELAVQVRALGAPLHLAAVCAGDDEALRKFVALKEKAARSVGIEFSAYYPEGEAEAVSIVKFLSADENVHGIFVELPLPDGWNTESLVSLIPREKDVDLITPIGEQSFYNGDALALPPSVGALLRVLAERDDELEGVRAVVVGNGKLIGKPVTHWLRGQGADVQLIDIDTKKPAHIAVSADILISGTGQAGLITEEWIKEGALVIDYGYAKQGDIFVGDVDAVSVEGLAGALTPVPGGMGPLVIAATLENLVTLATK